MWIIVGIILAFWILWIEFGGSGSGRPRPQRNPPGNTGSSSPESQGKQQSDSMTEPEPEPKPKSVDDDRDFGIGRTPYSERLERPDFNFDDVDSRQPSSGSDDPTALEEVPNIDELPDPDDLYEDQ